MSEDVRAKRTRKLFVTNPDDSGGSDHESAPTYATPTYHYVRPSLPSRPNPPKQSYPHAPYPLTTDQPAQDRISNPPLSSPSSTAEETPPPSTPGLPAPTPEITPDPPAIQESSLYSVDRPSFDGSQLPTPHATTLSPQQLKDPSSQRLAKVPTSSTPKRPATVLATADLERYVIVDITNARSGASIRECIFSKLNIYDDDEQLKFSIYQTEIGQFAISHPLTDDRLFELCRDEGDARGSLKFLVSHSSASVHEQPPLRAAPPPALLPSVNTIPPPVLPQQEPIAYETITYPLRPVKPRSRSRQGSLSSAAEQLPEMAGYEADLDNPGRDPRRPSHKSHHSPYGSLPSNHPAPSSPHTARQLTSQSQRPPSPLRPSRSLTPPEHPRPVDSESRYATSSSGSTVIGLQPPISPSRVRFNDGNASLSPPPPLRPLHGRSGSDAAAEREQIFRSSEQRVEEATRQWRQGRGSDSSPHLPDTSSRSQNIHRSTRQQASPSRYKMPYALQIPKPPRHPPPSIPSNESRFPSGVRQPKIVPSSFVVTWKGEGRGDQKPSQSYPRGLSSKSMDNLRAASSSSHPSTLQPGVRRTPLPISTSSAPQPAYQATPLPGQPKYDSRRQLPMPSTLDFTQSPQNQYSRSHLYPSSTISPNNDPYPRPQSAQGDPILSPPAGSKYKIQSPTFGSSMIDLTPLRSPRAPSPARAYTSIRETHPFPIIDRSSESQSEASTAPHSPPSPIRPRQRITDSTNSIEPTSSSYSESSLRSALGISPSSEGTLKPADSIWVQGVINEGNSTVVASRLESTLMQGTIRPDRSNSPIGTAISQSTYAPDSDSDEELWQKPPAKVQTTTEQSHLTSASGSTISNNPLPPPPPPRRPTPPAGRTKQNRNTFIENGESTWAPRPLPEDVYNRLEEFFPDHDLDKPVIEAASGGTSPTTTETHVLPPPAPLARSRNKKSIRVVAQESKQRYDSSANNTMLRKRSTKVWGSKAEEVPRMSAKNSAFSNSNGDSSSGPTTFKWVRGELIGKGTYGRVYLALNATTGEMIAVKQVELPRTASDMNNSRQITVVQALKSESETLKDLDHPNIVQYLGFEETPENLSIFLEYVPGGSVGSCLQKHGRFDENVTKSFTSQILSGLEYLHSKGILHRDLKADNILVETSGVCKISDFGISKRTFDEAGGAFTAMQGTVFWMAPEVINTQKKGYNFKIDIWSVGCVVLEMWAGSRPWEGDEVVAVMFKLYQANSPPPVPEGVTLSHSGEDFRLKCFAINPEERPSAAELRKHPYLILPPGWTFTAFK